MQETWVQPLGQEDALEEERAIHSNILAWEIPDRGAWWAKVHGVTKSLTQLSTHTHTHTHTHEHMCLTLVHLQSIFKSRTSAALTYIYLIPASEGTLFGNNITQDNADLSFWIMDPDQEPARWKVRFCEGLTAGKISPIPRQCPQTWDLCPSVHGSQSFTV